jgi:hypothetical protein
MKDKYDVYYMYFLFDNTFRDVTANDTYYKVDVTNYCREVLFYDAGNF